MFQHAALPLKAGGQIGDFLSIFGRQISLVFYSQNSRILEHCQHVVVFVFFFFPFNFSPLTLCFLFIARARFQKEWETEVRTWSRSRKWSRLSLIRSVTGSGFEGSGRAAWCQAPGFSPFFAGRERGCWHRWRWTFQRTGTITHDWRTLSVLAFKTITSFYSFWFNFDPLIPRSN